MTGFVSLVGAGPGDPELLTMRAVARLQAADLVLYDALIAREALRLAPQARWFYVGKRAGRKSISQETINRLLIRAARRGERVVRLKCGDPFVFGRGGEEALALGEAGIPYEIVPGISTAIAAPSAAGIPVTHRGLASAFVVVSGHSPVAYEPVLGSLKPNSATVVVLMGLGERASISSLLLERGWPQETPAAIVLNATCGDELVWSGNLADLSTPVLPADAAGVLVVGAVAGLATQIARGTAGESLDLVQGNKERRHV